VRACRRPGAGPGGAAPDAPINSKVLRAAGVVDAGALGFVCLLEGVVEYIERGRDVWERRVSRGVLGCRSRRPPRKRGRRQPRYCVNVWSAPRSWIARALKAALLALPLSRLRDRRSRSQVRLHAHLDDPAQLLFSLRRGLARCRESGRRIYSRRWRPGRGRRWRSFTDSGADLPAEALGRLQPPCRPPADIDRWARFRRRSLALVAASSTTR